MRAFRLVAPVMLAVTFGGAHTAYAESASFPSIAPSEVMISNSSSRVLHFRIGGNSCTGELSVQLKPDHYGTYECDGAKFFNFTIVTQRGGQTITRKSRLTPTRRYELYKDSFGAWDVRDIGPR